ncbi:MAG: hypothetical protein A2Y07_09675 [Planctomycetes bacterium GWF2_50_10]|nr:MAG: hypothetical protein A2Y07_09675 [Planctomycetes bacterium GWF2_50_10]
MVASNKRGSALILSMFFVMIFAAIAIAFSQMASNSIETAHNQQKGGKALNGALSGLEFVKYWLNGISVPGSVLSSNRLSYIAAKLDDKFTDAGATGVERSWDGSVLRIGRVNTDSAGTEGFSVAVRQLIEDGNDIIQADITGQSDAATRTIRVVYRFQKRGHSAFDFGIATKGPLSMLGSVSVTGSVAAVDASVYIESLDVAQALYMKGNALISGDVSIANASGYAKLEGSPSIGGITGEGAQSHVYKGVPVADFPTPVTEPFEAYCTTTITSDAQAKSSTTWSNVKIAANSNPTFNAQTTINGIMFIETPNVVTFGGGVTIRGMIVGDGQFTSAQAPADQKLVFQGNVTSYPINTLPNTSEYADVREETGTFIVAPGFSVELNGDFASGLNGTIAANGVKMQGNAGGEILGSIINYSNQLMGLAGSTDLFFNRSGTDKNPAGFMPTMLVVYDPQSYDEISLGE